jgi:hypothetical protein
VAVYVCIQCSRLELFQNLETGESLYFIDLFPLLALVGILFSFLLFCIFLHICTLCYFAILGFQAICREEVWMITKEFDFTLVLVERARGAAAG